MVSTACFTDEIASVLQQHYQGAGKPLLFLLYGLNTDSDNYSKPAEFQVHNSNNSFSSPLLEVIFFLIVLIRTVSDLLDMYYF